MTVLRVRMEVRCEQGHLVGTYYDKIEEKYPFWCDTCEADLRETGKWPWKLSATIEVQPEAEPPCDCGELTCPCGCQTGEQPTHWIHSRSCNTQR